MSAKELRRGEVLSRVKRGELKLTEATELLENRCLQLKPKRNQGVGAGARVTVQQGRDESLQVRFEGHEIEHEVIATPTPRLRTKPAPQGNVVAGRKPAANHPWRRAVLRKTRAANS